VGAGIRALSGVNCPGTVSQLAVIGIVSAHNVVLLICCILDWSSVVLPYKTATQSGVTQIAYNFFTPMIVTDVGGLPEIVPDDKVGYVTPPTVAGVQEAIESLYQGDNLERFCKNIISERKRFSWATMCDQIVEVLNICK
jgi:glycosyltransferase involved in cell wall biosynthesis